MLNQRCLKTKNTTFKKVMSKSVVIALFALSASLSLLTETMFSSAYAKKSYVREDLASDAKRLEATMRKEAAPAGTRTIEQLKKEAQDFLDKKEARKAWGASRTAVVFDSKDAQSWRLFAKASLAIAPKNYSEEYDLKNTAITAAYMAYQRANGKEVEAENLVLLAEIFAIRENWRSSLNAYRTSLVLNENALVRETYKNLREKYGFRVLDYKVDSDGSAPRVCFEFSEPLAYGKVDYAPYIVTSARDLTQSTQSATPFGVVPEDNKLCVEGLAHGQRYKIILRQGLPSSVDEELLKAADYEIYIRDRAPQVRFTGRNYVLPKVGQQGIPVVSVNTKIVDIEVLRVGDRNLLSAVRSDEFLQQLEAYQVSKWRTESGVKVWSGQLDTASELNKDVTTAFPVLQAVGKLEAGVYVMLAKVPSGKPIGDDEFGQLATQWFVVTDIGLTSFSANNGLHIIARSLATASPLKDVEVRLIARNNEILSTMKTDAAGYARFDEGLTRGVERLSPGIIVASDGTSDYGFLDLKQNAFDLSDRGVKGRATSGALDAFVFTERGVYRPGESVHITSLLRDAGAVVPTNMPLTVIIKRPDGVEYRRENVTDQGLGGRSLTVPLLSNAAMGTWRVQVHADPKREAIGETAFLVEDYVPERVELTLQPKIKTIRAGENAKIDVTAMYLYGAPATDLEVSGEVIVQKADKPSLAALEGYKVGIEDETVEASTQEIEAKGITDAKGKALMEVAIPQVVSSLPLQTKITLRLGESGGRAVSRSVVLPITPKNVQVGVKPLFTDDALSEGGKAEFDVVLITADGNRLSKSQVKWMLSKIEHRWQWYNKDGRWSYETAKLSRRELDGRFDVGETTAGRVSVPVSWGSYRLDVIAEGLEGAQTSILFNVGWDGGSRKVDTPDLLEIALDKSAYLAGETMKLNIKPRVAGQVNGAGKVTLAVVSDKMHELQTVDVGAEGKTVSLTAKSEWGAGAYVVALNHRPLDSEAKRMPSRAIGLAWFSVDKAARTLTLDIGAPKQMLPRQTLSVPIKLAGLNAGEEAYVNVSAVDVGILNLTRFETPDAINHYLGQRMLSAELRDVYGLLIDGMQGAIGAIRTGGDGPALANDVNPPAQEPLVRYSGVVKVGADGIANVSFDIPAFNGTARITAHAWSKTKIGQGSRDVIVRDPVVVSATMPRFLNVGDRSQLHLAIDNVDGASGGYAVEVGGLTASASSVAVAQDAMKKTFNLAKGAKDQVVIPINAAMLGTSVLDIKLTGPNQFASAQSLKLRVQPTGNAFIRRTVRELAANGGSFVLNGDVFTDLLAGSGQASLTVSPYAALDVPTILAALDRYPYGCTEQTISRALPLLYVNKLAKMEQLALDPNVEERIRSAIERVLSRQGADGSFGLWSVGGTDLWLDAYVGDFLTRAREAGFTIPKAAYEVAMDRLRNQVANAGEVDAKDAHSYAYALYVLARNGRPVMGDLRYLADTRLSVFSTPLSKAQLGAALALLGDRNRAKIVFESAVNDLQGAKPTTVSRSDYGSRLRDSSGLLTLLAETGSEAPSIQKASVVLEAARQDSRYTSTQENAWMILASHALSKESDQITLKMNDNEHKGALYRTYKAATIDKQPVTITNTSAVPARLVLGISGFPTQPEPSVDQGYHVQRRIFKLDGTQVWPLLPVTASAKQAEKPDQNKTIKPAETKPIAPVAANDNTLRVKQNERFVVVIDVTEKKSAIGEVLLVDPLPAGFEIDNPKLVSGTDLTALPWLKQDVEAAHTEYRDDRFVAAFSRSSNVLGQFTVAYTVRAVSPGRYVHVGAFVEDMYRPDQYGRSPFATLEVQPNK